MEFEITFRAFRPEDAEFINSLRRNENMESRIGGSKRFVSIEREKQWIHELIMTDHPETLYLAICERGSDEILGYTSVSDIDYRNGSCFWSGIKISPEKEDYGYGFQVALLLLKYIFEEMRMERCSGQCLEEHKVMVRLLEKAGFKKEGLMRNYVFKNGSHKNTWLFSILKDEYIIIKNQYAL